MVITLAFVEATAVFAAVYVTLVLWTRPLLTDSTESAGLLAQAMAFSLCYLLTSYYSDLYDLRIVRRFSDFLARLPKCIGIFVILMVSVSSLIPQARTGVEPFAASLLNTIGLLLVLRAAAHMFLRRHPFRERVLIVGTGPLAWRIAKEMEAVPHLCYSFVGFVDDGWPVPTEHLFTRGIRFSDLSSVFDQITDKLHPDRIIVGVRQCGEAIISSTCLLSFPA